MDKIKIFGLKLYSYHGCFDFEKEKGQEFLVDITIEKDLDKAESSDDLNNTVNYGEVSNLAAKIFKEEHFNLIEAAAENLANKLLISFASIKNIEVTVHKPNAPIEIPFEDVTVSVSRGWHEAYIAVGSNLSDAEIGTPEDLIENGKKMLAEIPGIVLEKASSLIVTKPYGVTDQPDFINGMFLIKTIFNPYELLDELHEIEAANKRERTLRWGPRTLDLDIIYYDDCIIDSAELTIPHIDMCNRDFVLKPLNEINPYKRHPINLMRPGEMLDRLKQ
ncbi:MAG: 2-amino-4-hydroxy-6-hydroxymethyldihydropteridine diphosphokinase [Lachnospiraceae bacterium]|nr:2-amino-4-hydroxy-6-hydroxymethyldihydropteridine diphosphokinase [Lachnospiraceae bacterium]